MIIEPANDPLPLVFLGYYQRVTIIFTKPLVVESSISNLFTGAFQRTGRSQEIDEIPQLFDKARKHLFFFCNDPIPRNQSHHPPLYRVFIESPGLVVEHDHEVEKVHCQTQRYRAMESWGTSLCHYNIKQKNIRIEMVLQKMCI